MAQVEKAIVVQAPADTVYQVWRNFQNFPNFMGNIEEVRDVGSGRSHWKAKGPLGSSAEWDAEITQDEPGRIIAWRSIESDEENVRTAGAVEFESIGDATRVMVTLDYEAPAGALGETIARIFANPSNQVEEDLERFKDSIESNAGYNDRNTDKVVGSNERASSPLAGHSQVVGKRPQSSPVDEVPVGPGMAQETGAETEQRGNVESGTTTAAGGAIRDADIGRDDVIDRGTPEPRTERYAERPAPRTRPTTTGTPGGALGAPTEKELKADPESPSEKSAPLEDRHQR